MIYHMTALCWIIFILGITGVAAEDDKSNVKVALEIEAKEQNENLWLEYKSDKCEWKLEGESIDLTNCTLDLGSQWEDPRGTYSCQKPDDPSSEVFLDVFVRKCQNCIKMDAATISGFVIADLIMIAFIGMAVYFVSGSETRRPGRAASDKQSLIGNDPNYQELGPRNGS